MQAHTPFPRISNNNGIKLFSWQLKERHYVVCTVRFKRCKLASFWGKSPGPGFWKEFIVWVLVWETLGNKTAHVLRVWMARKNHPLYAVMFYICCFWEQNSKTPLKTHMCKGVKRIWPTYVGASSSLSHIRLLNKYVLEHLESTLYHWGHPGFNTSPFLPKAYIPVRRDTINKVPTDYTEYQMVNEK